MKLKTEKYRNAMGISQIMALVCIIDPEFPEIDAGSRGKRSLIGTQPEGE
jgi:hypothetical protein